MSVEIGIGGRKPRSAKRKAGFGGASQKQLTAHAGKAPWADTVIRR